MPPRLRGPSGMRGALGPRSDQSGAVTPRSPRVPDACSDAPSISPGVGMSADAVAGARRAAQKRASSLVSLMGLGSDLAADDDASSSDGNTSSTQELDELERLQKLDRDIGTRIGHTLRAIYRPNLANESTMLQTVKAEWKGRRDVLRAENLARRQLSVREYMAYKNTREPNRVHAEQRNPVVDVQDRIATTLHQIVGRSERLIESRDVEREVAHRAKTPAAPVRVATDYDELIPKWQEENAKELAARQEQVAKLLESTRPKSAGSRMRMSGLLEVGRFKARLQRKQELATMRQELALLEAEQVRSELLHSQQVLQRVVIGPDHTFELNVSGTIEVHWLSYRLTLRERIQYNHTSGELMGNGGFSMTIPTRRRRADLDNIREMCLKGGLRFEVISEDTALENDFDERPKITEASEGLLQYALNYRSPALRRPDPNRVFAVPERAPVGMYMPGAHRQAIFFALGYLEEHEIAELRLVNHDIQRLVLDAVGVTSRRLQYLISLIGDCGVAFRPLSKRPARVGYTHVYEHYISRSPRRTARKRPPTNQLSYKGLGEDSCGYAAETSFLEEDDVYVSEKPVTVGQWRQIAARFPHIAHLVREEDLELMQYNMIAPSQYRNVHLIRKDDADYTDWDDRELELPYETCAKIAASLSASLPTWQQWELLARGNTGDKYPWGNGVPTEASLCLEVLPFSYLVPNSRKGMSSGNGYVEIADVDVNVQGLARVAQLPAETAAPVPGMQGTPATVAAETPPDVKVTGSGGALSGGASSGRPGSAGDNDTLASLFETNLMMDSSNRGKIGLSPMSKLRSVKTSALKQLRAGIRANMLGPEGYAEAGEAPAKAPPEETLARLRTVARNTRQLRRGVACFEAAKKDRQSTVALLAEKLEMLLAATAPAGGEAPFKRVARIGKEWNIVAKDLTIRGSLPVVDRCLRSLTDLYSLQDVNRTTAAYSRGFYASNHRCFSGPPAFCVAPVPRVLSRASREGLLRNPVREHDEQLPGDSPSPRARRGSRAGIAPSRFTSNADADLGDAAVDYATDTVQIRMKGRGVKRQHHPAGQAVVLPAPERACFRLAFTPYTANQAHPCRPQQRRCFQCRKPYHYTVDCPQCFPESDPSSWERKQKLSVISLLSRGGRPGSGGSRVRCTDDEGMTDSLDDRSTVAADGSSDRQSI